MSCCLASLGQRDAKRSLSPAEPSLGGEPRLTNSWTDRTTRHAFGLHSTIRVAALSLEPSQFLRYAAPPIRSGILLLTAKCQPPDRPSFELTRHTLGRPTVIPIDTPLFPTFVVSYLPPGRTTAAAVVVVGCSCQSRPSRNMAQHRTNSFRASATTACFFRAPPRLSRWYCCRAQPL